MYVTDFEYDNRFLSELGYMICSFDSMSGAQVSDTGQKISFNKVPISKGKIHRLTSTKYEDCIQATFSVCKNPCMYNEMEITQEEYRELSRWLNRHGFYRLHFVNDDEIEPCYYEASFNLRKVTIGGVLYGVELEMVTNRPFGFGEVRYETFDFSDPTKTHTLWNESDETGYIYPDLKITCLADGDITISNELTKCSTTIKNCSVDEIITFDGDMQTISTNVDSHDIYNDFNYNYFKIANDINNRGNKIFVSSACEVEISYSPIIKYTP